MKALIISDTHGLTTEVARVAKRDAYQKGFHCGDFCTDTTAFPFNKMVLVKGNNDYRAKVANEEVVDWAGFRFFLTHGHLYQAEYSLLKLGYKASEVQADVVLFGHTHFPVCFEEDGVIYCNPGSLKQPRGYKTPSYVTLEITQMEQEKNLSFTYYDPQGRKLSSLSRTFSRKV